jgi:hypothetical protein
MNSFEPDRFNFMFTLVPILIGLGFIAALGAVVYNLVRYARNARSPKESVYALIVSKRTDVRQHSDSHPGNDNGAMHHSSSTRTYYYITLEFDNGERKEYLDVKSIYGLVAEGDKGYAQTQGEWIVAFIRG